MSCGKNRGNSTKKVGVKIGEMEPKEGNGIG